MRAQEGAGGCRVFANFSETEGYYFLESWRKPCTLLHPRLSTLYIIQKNK